MPPRSSPCTVCGHAELPAVNAAIMAGTSARQIERRFGVGRGAAGRHRANCLATPADRKKAATRKARVVQAVRPPTEPVRLDNAGAVVDELFLLYGEAKSLLQAAQTTGDTRLAERTIGQALSVLEKIGTTVGLFKNSAVTVNVDASQRKLQLAVASMSTEDLRRFMAGDEAIDVPALPGAIEP